MMVGEDEPRTKYKCDICGHIDYWGPGWVRYSSYQLDEAFPDQAPCACSDRCREILLEKIDSGEIVPPKLSRGPIAKIVRPRKGY